jgi:protein-S-isoprenylcysteine O-methyltransferase Ste14
VSTIDPAERAARRLGGLVAIAAGSTALPGAVSAVRERGAVSGRPELVFTPLRLLVIAVGWFGAAAAAWRPLPIRPGRAARWTLLAGGLALYLTGMGMALAGRLALGASYRPSSSLGATLAPDHRLVTTGPFARVRHPMYLGLMLAAFGAVAVYRTWATVLFVIQLPILVVRARREDELLERTFGEAWQRYRARVPAWLPRPPGGWGSLAANSSTPRPVTAQVRVFIARDPSPCSTSSLTCATSLSTTARLARSTRPPQGRSG